MKIATVCQFQFRLISLNENHEFFDEARKFFFTVARSSKTVLKDGS